MPALSDSSIAFSMLQQTRSDNGLPKLLMTVDVPHIHLGADEKLHDTHYCAVIPAGLFRTISLIIQRSLSTPNGVESSLKFACPAINSFLTKCLSRVSKYEKNSVEWKMIRDIISELYSTLSISWGTYLLGKHVPLLSHKLFYEMYTSFHISSSKGMHS